MHLPPDIERGNPGWKTRRKEQRIMVAMQRATKPNTGWDIYQKVKRSLGSWSGDECCELMKGLADSGYLRIVGNDADCGYLYEVATDA